MSSSRAEAVRKTTLLSIFSAEALQHLETVEARHRDVQHHEIGSRPPNGLERGRPVRARCEQGVAGVHSIRLFTPLSTIG